MSSCTRTAFSGIGAKTGDALRPHGICYADGFVSQPRTCGPHDGVDEAGDYQARADAQQVKGKDARAEHFDFLGYRIVAQCSSQSACAWLVVKGAPA
jgi:hypothetical protein